MGPSEDLINEVKRYLDDLFTIKDLDYAKYFFGLEIVRSADGMSVSQHKYTMDIISDSGMAHANPALTPLPAGLKLSRDSGTYLQEPDRFRRLIGRLLYLGFTRPDISFAVQQLSQFLQHPTDHHWHVATHIVRYLNGTTSTGLLFAASNTLQSSVYTDADWGAYVDSPRSVTGDFRISVVTPIPFWCDNQAALHITANPVFHERTKHLDIDCHVVRDQFKAGFISPSFVSSKFQIADLFTKSLPSASFASL
ncbi:UNVERIFIED_CONTAM: Retrovirus-related Pol polyprotein from transposon RE2 [Sesamum radiatum]|uniref:Retrovirus-related Pol polyprotein from transposon RE2 n=1 Tax=Sesamum radiatum TaxID=300843 RepID=A0AAW2Q147_SESRA